MRFFISRAPIYLALIASCARLDAAVVFSDSFADGGRTNGSDALDGAWYTISNITPNTADVVDGALKLERTTGTAFGFNPHAVTTFSPQGVAVGQTITLSFEFQSLGGANGTGIRFGLYHSGGTNLEADVTHPTGTSTPPVGPVFQNDLGYSVFAPHQQSGNIGFYSRTANTVGNALLIGSNAAINSLIANTAFGGSTDTTTVHLASLSLTRTLGGYDYSGSYAGTVFGGSTAIVNTSTFNTLSIFGIVGQNQALTIDNVQVSVIPEPSATVVSCLGLLGLAARRRR